MDHDPATALAQAVQGCVSASADVRMHVLAKATPLVGELRSRNREAQLELEGKKLAEEEAQLQKQSRLAHRHLVRLEQGIASLHQSVQRHAS